MEVSIGEYNKEVNVKILKLDTVQKGESLKCLQEIIDSNIASSQSVAYINTLLHLK